ncbi:MAG: hypothetical protein EXQ52_19050 [Bryobacterales bacterium]|nr:hypothetical protein [Bryobacterales bacterium]
MSKAPGEYGFSLAIEYFREEDGRWFDLPAVPGVASTARQETGEGRREGNGAASDRRHLEHGEALPGPMNVAFSAV